MGRGVPNVGPALEPSISLCHFARSIGNLRCGYTSSPPPPVGDVRAMHTNLMRATSIKLETKQGIIAESFLQAPVRAGVAAILITYDRSKEA